MHLGEDHAPSHTTDSSALNAASMLYRRHYPVLCAFARARGCEVHDAEDAVQELFAKLVAQGQHERAAAIVDHGEQAAFLFARLRTHLIKRWQHRTRQRRGGGAVCFSLSDENGADIDVADDRPSPDNELDRDWARSVIERALHSFSQELQAQGRGDVWNCFEESIIRGCRAARPQSGALRTALHRAKRRLRALILSECREDEGVLHAVLA
ncbi:RNA polymerase sigma factor [Prosthecobacter sp.]|uniref:RNA polymerase sigma factor n=1 Tax=Prosthecobacter sp. TaxID=1965333 RepID=UPI0037849E98